MTFPGGNELGSVFAVGAGRLTALIESLFGPMHVPLCFIARTFRSRESALTVAVVGK